MTFNPQPKHAYYRGADWEKAVRQLPCQLCGLYGQTQSSHPNWAWSGKGKSIKGSNVTAALCVSCHSELDQGSKLNRDEREYAWLRAFWKTAEALANSGKLVVR